MQSAKDAVKSFLNKSGKDDTDVHERVAPAVTHENIESQKREEVTTAIDKEIHQDHYHTSVQPIVDQERLAEQHHHRVMPTEHREFEHNDAKDVERRLEGEAAKYTDATTRTEGASTSVAAPVAGGQHVHHHVHETIQPVIEKRTIEPHVIHTTAPIHEVHHNSAQHHDSTMLPTMTLDEFQKNGGSLSGRGERAERFEGAPKTVGQLAGKSTTQTNNGTTATGTGHRKPSLMDKINPRVDADGDGKKGIMT